MTDQSRISTVDNGGPYTDLPFSKTADSDGFLDDDDPSDDESFGILTLLPNYDKIRDKTNGVWQNEDGGSSYTRKAVTSGVIGAAYLAYFYAVLAIKTDVESSKYWCDADGFVIVLTYLVGLFMTYFLVIKPYYGQSIYNAVFKPINKAYEKSWKIWWVRWIVYLVLVGAVVAFLAVDAMDDVRSLQSAFGYLTLLFLGFLFSKKPRKVRWRHVVWGLALQFILALLVLRWPMGQSIFQCLTNKVVRFLQSTDAGTEFVFGELASVMKIFAFSVLPVTLYFGFCVQILYYLGVMQWVVVKVGWLLQISIGTTSCESINAAANVFLGMTEAPLLIKPFLYLMTNSELHAVMTGGFATIAGSLLAAYIAFGVDPLHLLTASVMSAPTALAFSKLFYPETRKSKTSATNIPLKKGEEVNILHAAMIGVTNAIPLIANIGANLIAFIAAIDLVSHFLDWSCTLVGAEEGICTLENIFGTIFMPLAWLMGVEWSECDEVGELIGLKTIVNEFVAYARLHDMMDEGILSERSIIISTYALCGFSNISSIGIVLGGFGAMAPTRKEDMAKIATRAMIAGSCVCFLNACMAGMLVRDFVPT